MQINLVHLVILAFSCWRITGLLADEEGPFRIFERIRNKAGIKYNEKNEPYPTSEFARLLTCVWCLSMWVGIIIVAVYARNENVIWYLLPFALSAFAQLADKQLWRGYKKH